jgi:hypothetical protein
MLIVLRTENTIHHRRSVARLDKTISRKIVVGAIVKKIVQRAEIFRGLNRAS